MSVQLEGVPTLVRGIPATAFHLSDKWTAVVLESGEVLMQHRVAHISGHTESVNLAELNQPGGERLVETLNYYGSERMVVRCLLLESDGSVHAEAHGVSLAGEPKDTFEVFEAADAAAGWYMRVNQDHFERHLAEKAIDGE